jgi:RodZ C-terminal domain
LSVAMIVVLALVLGYGVYRAVTAVASPHHSAAATSQSSHRPSAAPVDHSSPAVSATPAQQASHTVVIQLTAIEDCWVEFTTTSGQYLSQAYVVGGTSRTWTFRHTVTMQIGNPGGIELTVNGRNLGRPGAPGQPVTLSFGPGHKLPSPVTG